MTVREGAICEIIVGSGVSVWFDTYGDLRFSINRNMARQDSAGNYCAIVMPAQADRFFVELEKLKQKLYQQRALFGRADVEA